MPNNIFPTGQAAITPAAPAELTPHQMLVRADLVSYFALTGALIGLALGVVNSVKCK